MAKSTTSTWGNGAAEWGKYESLRLWGTAWPVLLGLAVTAGCQLLTDAGGAVSPGVGAIAGLLAKAIQQWASNNTGKKL